MSRLPAFVELRAVTCRYGEHVALDAVDARIAAAAVIAVVGPNGAGKSTLIAVLAGLRAPDSGEVAWSAGTRPRVALAVQRTDAGDTLPITVDALVAMGRWAHRPPWSRRTAADRRVIADALERLDLVALRRRPIAELSGGQRQRALVARALAQDAPLLLLDEPATGLDTASRELVDGALRAAADAGTTVVHASHDAASIAASDAVVRLGALSGSRGVEAAGPVDNSTHTDAHPPSLAG